MRSKTGTLRALPRTGISAIYYDEFLRQFPKSAYRIRIEESWDRASLFAAPHLQSEWNNPQFGVTGNFYAEEWNNPQSGLTENFYNEDWNITIAYASEIVLIEPGYMFITEPWEPTHYGLTPHTSELWDFEIEYISDSSAVQFYEEWDS